MESINKSVKPLPTNLDCFWRAGLNTPTLSQHEVHVWLASPNASISQLDGLRQHLSGDELEKARQYRSIDHQSCFVISRGILRIILGRYLNCLPRQLHFDYGPYGKPVLVQGAGQKDIQFNLSHSRDYVVYSIALSAQLGIDLEYIHPFPEIRKIVDRFFSLKERNVIFSLPLEHQQTEAFFRYWTQIEAVTKAKGQSLLSDFGQCTSDIVTMIGDPASLNASNWSLYQFSPVQNYIASLAIKGNNWHISYWRHVASELVCA